MKKNVNFILSGILLFLVISCNGKKNAPGTGNSVNDSTGTIETYAVCVWDRTPVKDTPDDKGKWVTSLNLGEKCTYTDDSKEIATGTKTVTYYKIQLLDGKEGWVLSDLVVLNSRPATFIQNADIYSRPDLLTKSSNSFSKMDIVAVKSNQNGFVEVVGKRSAGKWIETAWVKDANLTFEDADIAVAKFTVKALAITDNEKRKEAINSIITNSDFSSSIFISEIKDMISAEEEVLDVQIDTSDLSE